MRTIWLVLVVASMACYREAASPSSGPSAAPLIAKAPRPEPRASRDILAYLPGDTELVISVDLKAVRASELWVEYEPQLYAAIGKLRAGIRDHCGFDPVQTVESMTFGLRNFENKESVTVIRGVDRDALIACITADQGRTPGTPIVVDRGILRFAHDGDRLELAGFADRSTMVIHSGSDATPDTVRALLRSGVPLRGDPSFLAQLERIPSDVAVWFLVRDNASVMRRFPATGPAVRGIHGEIRVGASVAAAVHLIVDDANQAAQLAAAADPWVRQGRGLFDKLSATSDGPVITVECELSSTKLHTLVAAAVSMYRSRAATPEAPIAAPRSAPYSRRMSLLRAAAALATAIAGGEPLRA